MDMKIAWRNIWRNPRRSILTMAAISFAAMLLVFMLSWQFGSYATMINASVKLRTGHLQVQAKGYLKNKEMRMVVKHPSSVSRILDHTPHVSAYGFRANGFSLVSSGKRTCGALVTGIDPAREAQVSTVKQLVRQGAYLKGNDTNAALVGSLLARNLRVAIGDELTVLGQGADGSVAAAIVRIKGIFSSGVDDLDRSTIQVPLSFFQDIYSMGDSVHEIVVLADALEHVSQIKRSIAAGLSSPRSPGQDLAVYTWWELTPGLLQVIEMDLSSGIISWLILVLVVAFSILNTFLMAVVERTREFGVMSAIGTSPGRLTKLLFLESFLMTAIGVLIGTLLGCAITFYVQQIGIDVSGASEVLRNYGISGRMYPKLSWLTATAGPCVVLFITLLTALYPAIKIRRLRPVEAMTHV